LIPYWILFGIPAWRAIVKPKNLWGRNTLLFLGLFFSIFIGLRDEVGGDWGNYIVIMNQIEEGLKTTYWQQEQGFTLINLLSINLGTGIYLVNLICAVIFTTGLLWFCKNTPRPWLALTMAIPYLVIVVACGYTRQAASIGFLLFAYTALGNGKVLKFIIFCILGALFQKTSLIALPLAISSIASSKKLSYKIFNLSLLGIAFYTLYRTFLLRYVNTFYNAYIISEMQSEGAFIRVTLNLIPAIIFLLFSHRLNLSKQLTILWKSISLFSVACAVGLIFFTSSTFIDRLALYALPIQLFVAARVPDFKILNIPPKYLTFSVITFAFLIQFVWLNFSSYRWVWLPYQNLLWSYGV
tara:strand:+ start:423 stop:1484 length:1062 start_codon:yes stop_codon:yes gene_type:complete